MMEQFNIVFSDCFLMAQIAGFLILVTMVIFLAFVADASYRRFLRIYFKKRYFIVGSFIAIEMLLWSGATFGNIGFQPFMSQHILTPLPSFVCRF